MSQSSPLKPALESLRDKPEELIEIILRQGGVIEELRQDVEQLRQQIKDLNDRNDGLSGKVDELERKAARQAAPFRIEDKDRVVEPKKPGRAPGHEGSRRTLPDHVDEEIRVPLAACPRCGGAGEKRGGGGGNVVGGGGGAHRRGRGWRRGGADSGVATRGVVSDTLAH